MQAEDFKSKWVDWKLQHFHLHFVVERKSDAAFINGMRLWRNRFQRAASAIGQSVRIERVPLAFHVLRVVNRYEGESQRSQEEESEEEEEEEERSEELV